MTVHVPVLVDEILEHLPLAPDAIVLDGTLGGGGHAARFLSTIGPAGRIIGFDRDPQAVAETQARIADDRLIPFVANYADAPEVLKSMGIEQVDAILLDLGLSSDQLADRERGFSYHSSGDLDLRFNPLQGEPASRLVNRLSEKHLADLIYQYGEERFSRRIARQIIKQRQTQKIETAADLAELLRRSVPRSKNHDIDPATRTFQALRIAVNEELKWLKVAIERLPHLLKPGGRIGVISFHSLEDRIVKHGLLESNSLNVITKKPIKATDEEISANPRSRSAKLRVAEKT